MVGATKVFSGWRSSKKNAAIAAEQEQAERMAHSDAWRRRARNEAEAVPFGASALKNGAEVDGVYASQPTTPKSTQSAQASEKSSPKSQTEPAQKKETLAEIKAAVDLALAQHRPRSRTPTRPRSRTPTRMSGASQPPQIIEDEPRGRSRNGKADYVPYMLRPNEHRHALREIDAVYRAPAWARDDGDASSFTDSAFGDQLSVLDQAVDSKSVSPEPTEHQHKASHRQHSADFSLLDKHRHTLAAETGQLMARSTKKQLSINTGLAQSEDVPAAPWTAPISSSIERRSQSTPRSPPLTSANNFMSPPGIPHYADARNQFTFRIVGSTPVQETPIHKLPVHKPAPLALRQWSPQTQTSSQNQANAQSQMSSQSAQSQTSLDPQISTHQQTSSQNQPTAYSQIGTQQQVSSQSPQSHPSSQNQSSTYAQQQMSPKSPTGAFPQSNSPQHITSTQSPHSQMSSPRQTSFGHQMSPLHQTHPSDHTNFSYNRISADSETSRQSQGSTRASSSSQTSPHNSMTQYDDIESSVCSLERAPTIPPKSRARSKSHVSPAATAVTSPVMEGTMHRSSNDVKPFTEFVQSTPPSPILGLSDYERAEYANLLNFATLPDDYMSFGGPVSPLEELPVSPIVCELDDTSPEQRTFEKARSRRETIVRGHGTGFEILKPGTLPEMPIQPETHRQISAPPVSIQNFSRPRVRSLSRGRKLQKRQSSVDNNITSRARSQSSVNRRRFSITSLWSRRNSTQDD
ncbi:hypothetical protein AMS68_007092 [Peltaster fructicola]|uniref:Uncharacterized protein n=1 Tax=Peltaster fructicola TaxID=286661 RepID=A0A6H0Y3S0_9PEZI|nr:hypothetical protein AMS68_007092 [Peltaster fructicola]